MKEKLAVVVVGSRILVDEWFGRERSLYILQMPIRVARATYPGR